MCSISLKSLPPPQNSGCVNLCKYTRSIFLMWVDRCHARWQKELSSQMCVSNFSSFSRFLYYNGHKCVHASVPCKQPRTKCALCVCMRGKGKDLKAQEEKQKTQRSGVNREAGGVLGFCFSPKKELRVWSKQSPRGKVKQWQTLQPKGYTAMCHHKWHIADLSHNSSTVYTVHIT